MDSRAISKRADIIAFNCGFAAFRRTSLAFLSAATLLALGCSSSSDDANNSVPQSPAGNDAGAADGATSNMATTGVAMVPVQGATLIATVRIQDGKARLGTVETKAGSFSFRVRDPFGTVKKDGPSTARRLVVLDGKGNELFQTDLSIPTKINVPPPLPGDTTSPVFAPVELPNPSTAIGLPAFAVDTIVELYEPGAISPSDRTAVPAAKPPTRVMDGPVPPPSEPGVFHLNIVASGYDSATMPTFRRKAGLVRDYLLTHEPFSSARPGSVAIHNVENTSELDCATGCGGTDRALCCDTTKVITAVAGSANRYDEILVIHNTTVYSGAAFRDYGFYESNSYNSLAHIYGGELDSDSSWQGPVMALHELGHSMGNLCDEYTYDTESTADPECVNCRADCSTWSESDLACTLGCSHRGDYRRPVNSIMYSLFYTTFNVPSLLEFERRLQYFGVSTYCTASLASDYAVHIPALKYASAEGERLMWADLALVPTTDGSLVFRAVNYGDVANAGALAECTAATLSSNLDLDIPYLQLVGPGGSSYFWAKLTYLPGTEEVRFVVSSYGSI